MDCGLGSLTIPAVTKCSHHDSLVAEPLQRRVELHFITQQRKKFGTHSVGQGIQVQVRIFAPLNGFAPSPKLGLLLRKAVSST
jgi:hypothetical protein